MVRWMALVLVVTLVGCEADCGPKSAREQCASMCGEAGVSSFDDSKWSGGSTCTCR